MASIDAIVRKIHANERRIVEIRRETDALRAQARAELSKSAGVAMTARQREVLEKVWQRKSNKEIAADLNIEVRTVKFHVSGLLKAMGVQTRGELCDVIASGAIDRKGGVSDEQNKFGGDRGSNSAGFDESVRSTGS